MNTVLIVIDIQNDFVDGSLGTKEAVQAADRAAEAIMRFDGSIIVTMDTHGQNYLETAEGKKLPVLHCIRMTKGWQLNEKIQSALTQKDYRIIEKGTFGSVDLVTEIGRMLDEDKELKVRLLGLCTDICVVSNALLLKAHFPELCIEVDASCCAGVTPATHQAALETMKMCQIEVLNA